MSSLAAFRHQTCVRGPVPRGWPGSVLPRAFLAKGDVLPRGWPRDVRDKGAAAQGLAGGDVCWPGTHELVSKSVVS